MSYYSQFGEDRILASLFIDKRKGFCIEVGANDGVNDSTTLYFEKMGWECLLIEPNPELCIQIRASRTAHLVECAASDRRGEVSLFVAEGAPRAHGVSTILECPDAQEKIKSYGFSTREVKVETRTLDDILNEKFANCQIDFISIDVEGHELAVLKGTTLNRWRPGILLIEDNSNYADPTIRNYLKEHGYLPFKRTGVNDWYASIDHPELIGWNARGTYFLGRMKSRAKDLLRRVPGVLWLKAALRKLRASL